MAISTFPAAGGGGRPDTVFAAGTHAVDISEGYYIVSKSGEVSANDEPLSEGFQKLPAITNLSVGVAQNPDTWVSQNSGSQFNIFGVTFGNDLFVAVAENRNILVSSDGINWSQTGPDDSTFSFQDVTFGNGLFVTVGTNSQIYTSPDGTNWTERTSPTTSTLNTVSFGDGLFFAGGTFGDFATSSDGITWTIRSTAQNATWFSSAFGNGVYVVVGDDGDINRSTDGINWSDTGSAGSIDFVSVAFGNDLFIAINAGFNDVYRSTDGNSWTLGSVTGAGNTKNSIVFFANNMFIIVDENEQIYKSENGIDWELLSTSITDETLYAMAFGNQTFVTVGGNGTILTSLLFDENAGLLLTELPEAIEPGA